MSRAGWAGNLYETSGCAQAKKAREVAQASCLWPGRRDVSVCGKPLDSPPGFGRHLLGKKESRKRILNRRQFLRSGSGGFPNFLPFFFPKRISLLIVLVQTIPNGIDGTLHARAFSRLSSPTQGAGAFAKRAGHASKREVFKRGSPSFGNGVNVIHMEGGLLTCL